MQISYRVRNQIIAFLWVLFGSVSLSAKGHEASDNLYIASGVYSVGSRLLPVAVNEVESQFLLERVPVQAANITSHDDKIDYDNAVVFLNLINASARNTYYVNKLEKLSHSDAAPNFDLQIISRIQNEITGQRVQEINIKIYSKNDSGVNFVYDFSPEEIYLYFDQAGGFVGPSILMIRNQARISQIVEDLKRQNIRFQNDLTTGEHSTEEYKVEIGFSSAPYRAKKTTGNILTMYEKAVVTMPLDKLVFASALELPSSRTQDLVNRCFRYLKGQ